MSHAIQTLDDRVDIFQIVRAQFGIFTFAHVRAASDLLVEDSEARENRRAMQCSRCSSQFVDVF